MKPFGCPVTILNTKHHLGKFDGKADEGFSVGYSLNSNGIRVFNSRRKIVEDNLHIRFSENTPNVVGSGPDWLFNIDELTRTMIYEPIVTDPSKGIECNDQEKEMNVNNTNNVNTVSLTINAVGTNKDNELPFDPNMPASEDVGIFNFSNKDEDDDTMANMNNLDSTIQMDVKSDFLYEKIKEEVYVCQPPRFKDPDFLIEYTKLKKHFMDYIKLLKLGMKPCQHISWIMDFKEEK
uniref:Retrovirus-related Pol polyprotein from transposon TNT 1-94 n=1 Tax=Tanacetum cinerariifolium TaxID=118510 RepID=A0A6L2LD48_TANCI|nr:retrovirus-related Pol polyprotein from transposon TNT 1-94 [Tanacetum cinerariifolium]